MRKNEVIYDGKLTGTISEQKDQNKKQPANVEDNDLDHTLKPIQQSWEVNPVDEENYDGTIGYKNS